MNKMKFLILTIILFFCVSIRFVSAETLADFDFINNDVTQGFDGWGYSPYGDNLCNIYNGASQSNMCSEVDVNGYRRSFYNYYNGYNSDHMGWLRWGYFDSEDVLAIKGNSLKFVFTGGAYDNNGPIAYSGSEIRAKEQFNSLISNNVNPYSSRLLPGDLTMYFITGGTYNTFQEFTGKDRLSVWVLPPENSKYTFDYQHNESYSQRPENLFSWYPFVDNSNGDHYYHEFSNINMGGWIHLLFDAHPVHNNSGDDNPYSYYRVGGSDYPGDAVKYFENVNAFSLRSIMVEGLNSPSYLYLDEIDAYKVNQPENDETIAGIGVGFDPITERFDISFNDKYRCAECNSNYEVKYSFSPITNINYTSAILCNVTNFDRDASTRLGEIVKPTNGYSQIWAGLEINDSDKNLLIEGQTIYFAVKDISNRSHLSNRDVFDLEYLDVAGVGQVRRVDLVKTIDYTIYPVNRPLKINTNALEDAHANMPYNVQLEGLGGIQPYTWSASLLPNGLTLNSNGVLSGTPTTVGSYIININLSDANKPLQNDNLQISINIFNQESCMDGVDNDSDALVDCQDSDCEEYGICSTLLINFGDSANSNIFRTSWTTVFMDKYTGYSTLGSGGTITIAGSNGNYNYQSIGGEDFLFKKDDKIKVFWYNNLNTAIEFTPKISFSDIDRPSGDEWNFMSYSKVEGRSIITSEYSFNLNGEYSLVNISSNSDDTNNLVCDKILWIHSGEEKVLSMRSDVNRDSKINTIDAMLTQRSSLGLDMTETAWWASAITGDADCDGVLNSIDAVLVFRYSLNLKMDETGWCEK